MAGNPNPPYWGNLDPPAVSRKGSVRRSGNENGSNIQQSPRYPPQQPQPKANRISSQSQALTVSTQSPFVSPTASSFKADGLAPRPPSFPYDAAEAYNNDYLDKRRRRASRDTEDYYKDNENTVPPPAAPDVPRNPPPLSYKQPYSSSGPPATYPARSRAGSTRRPEGPVDANQTVSADSYRGGQTEDQSRRSGAERRQGTTSTEYRRDQHSIGGESEQPRGYPEKGVVRRGIVDARKERPEYHDPAAPSRSRKGSTAETEAQRRREWAPDRSPLQRLELTLDSITKEEKRARVEEAELLAREAKAGRGGDRLNQNSVRFRNRPVAKPAETPAQAAPQSLPEAGLVRSLSNKQRDELQRSGTIERKRPDNTDSGPNRQLGKGFDYQPQRETTDIISGPDKSTVPQRGPSFRERAASSAVGAVAGAVTSAGLSRSVSNKLKKEPPGDPWFSRRQEAEKKYQEVTPKRPSVDTRREPSTMTGGPLGSSPVIKLHENTRNDGSKRQNAPRPVEIGNLGLDDNYLYPAPVRRNPSSKGGQPTSHSVSAHPPESISPQQQQMHAGRLDRSEELGPEGTQHVDSVHLRTGIKTVNGIENGVESDDVEGNNKQGKAAHGPDGRRHFSNVVHMGYKRRSQYVPGNGLYAPHKALNEWKRGGVAALTGALLDLEVRQTEAEKDRAWWEADHAARRRPSAAKQQKLEAHDSEAENNNDSKSSYEDAPTLRLFAQPMDLLPPPPAQVDGGADELAPEYVDPIAGIPKIGRDGRTLHVRPVDQLDEEKDLSIDESDNGLFERQRSTIDTQVSGHDGKIDMKGIPAERSQRTGPDGERLGKYAEVKSFRLHVERGVTFWRFNIEIELRDQQQRIAYRINGGPATGFWVPARGKSMNIVFHSCNGFSLSVNPDQFSGPDPMWRDVLNTHQTRPFHVMIGGGDQIYNDCIMKDTLIFSHWLSIKNPIEKHNAPFTPQMQEELESFYLDRYAVWFSQGLFALANSQIPMVNIFDDHDIIDGFGSYPHHFMDSPVFTGLGAIAFKYYMLFQHQSIIDEGEETEPSWLLGIRPGPYIKELSRSVFMFMGSNIAFLGLDCRTERSRNEVVTDDTYTKIFDRMHKEITKGETKHLIVLLGVPIAYPRLVWLENILTSRLMVPIKAVSKAGMFGHFLNQFDGGVEILDDLDDHWTAKNHKKERNWFIEELQYLAAEKSIRITILGGDVHLAAIGQFYSNRKLGIPKDRDFRYMPNIISSAIVNAPPPNALADVLNRRNKIHHLNDDTDEDMIPIFTHDVTGAKRNNKRLLPRRNWCSIREYSPDMSPPPTPPDERSPSPPPRGGLLRHLSSSRGPSYRPDAGPPPSRGLMRNFSLRGRTSTDSERPGIRQRTLSLSRKDFMPANLFHRSPKRRPGDGGINGYGSSSDEEGSPDQELHQPKLRGGAADESYLPPDGAAPFRRTRVGRKAVVRDHEGLSPYDESPQQQAHEHHEQTPVPESPRRPFHRTPTGMSEKERRRLGASHEVDLEGGLDICLNVEISQKDPAGITVPYRLLVPALWYEVKEEDQDDGYAEHERMGTGLKRFVSLGRGKAGGSGVWKGKGREDDSEGEE